MGPTGANYALRERGAPIQPHRGAGLWVIRAGLSTRGAVILRCKFSFKPFILLLGAGGEDADGDEQSPAVP